MKPDTLMDMRTDVNAVPHTSLGYHFLRVQVRTIGAWRSSKGEGAKVGQKLKTERDEQVEMTSCVLVCRVH